MPARLWISSAACRRRYWIAGCSSSRTSRLSASADESDVSGRPVRGEIGDAHGQHELAKNGEERDVGIRAREAHQLDVLVREEHLHFRSVGGGQHAGAVDVATPQRLGAGARRERDGSNRGLETVQTNELAQESAGRAALRPDGDALSGELAELLRLRHVAAEDPERLIAERAQRDDAARRGSAGHAARHEPDGVTGIGMAEPVEILELARGRRDAQIDALPRQDRAIAHAELVVRLSLRSGGHHDVPWRKGAGNDEPRPDDDPEGDERRERQHQPRKPPGEIEVHNCQRGNIVFRRVRESLYPSRPAPFAMRLSRASPFRQLAPRIVSRAKRGRRFALREPERATEGSPEGTPQPERAEATVAEATWAIPRSMPAKMNR